MSGRYASPPETRDHSLGRPRWDASLRGVNADRGEYKEDTDLAGSGLKACKSPEDRGDRRASKRILGTNSGGGRYVNSTWFGDLGDAQLHVV